MDPVIVGAAVFVVTSGAALFGVWLHRVMPADHFADGSKAAIQGAAGFIATMTALVLGLVTASAKNSFDEVATAVRHSAVEVLALDRTLARYGDEAAPLRARLKAVLAARIDLLWRDGEQRTGALASSPGNVVSATEGLSDAIRALVPRTDMQRALRERSLDLAETLLQARWITVAASAPSVPLPFLVVLLFWLSVTFTSLGMFAPRNATVFSMVGVCSVSIAAALFLVLELDSPFSGWLRVSADPLRRALEHVGH